MDTMDKGGLAFDSVLSSRTTDKRIALIVFPVVLVLAAIVAFAAVAISRMSGLQDQVKIAQRQADEAQKAADEKDRQLMAAKGDASTLSSAGQGAAVLAPTQAGSGANGVAVYHPESKALNLFVYNLQPAPEGQDYRLVVTDAQGQEQLVQTPVTPDDRGAAHLLARDLPEGLARLEVALVPKQGGGAAAAQGTGSGGAQQAGEGQQKPAERDTVMVGQLPKPGEAGVVMPKPPEQPAKAQGRARR
jgi:type II secretory pathway pseudopilin PulG